MGSKANLAANLRGEGLYQMAAKMGLAYRSSKAALCMGKSLDNPCRPLTTLVAMINIQYQLAWAQQVDACCTSCASDYK